MSFQYVTPLRPDQEEVRLSQDYARQLESFLSPLLLLLDRWLDVRLVRTLVQCCVAILRFRHSKQGLWLSELGSYLPGAPGQSRTATAGTKRLGKLIRSLKWNAGHIEHFLLAEAAREVERLKQRGERILCLFDGSVLEKPESRALEGLTPVISSKAKRTNRSRKGVLWNAPALRPIRVMGMEWTGTLIAGMSGAPRVAVMRWWTRKGDSAQSLREVEEEVLRTCVRHFGPLLTFVFDRGYASGPWLQVLARYRVRFIIRWIKKHVFLDEHGREKKLWEIGRGKKYRAHRVLQEPSGLRLCCDLWWTALRHPACAQPLFLVKARLRDKPCYLITNEPVRTAEQAWDIFLAYRRRWQIETSFRYGKSELALESPRLWSWENRLKLLALVVLVYAFLIFLLADRPTDSIQALLRLKCHRTGKRCQQALVPLYRLRWALSRLWLDCRPLLGSLFPPNWETLLAFASFRREGLLKS